jgi:hypothetical protein
MTKRKQSGAGASDRILDEKNRIRGVIDSAKAPIFQPNSERPEVKFPRELSSVLTQSREKLKGKEAAEFISWVDRQLRAQLPYLRSAAVDSSLNDTVATRKSKSFTDELTWVMRLISARSKEIQEFRLLADSVENLALTKQFVSTKGVLNQVAKQFGRSIWWADASISIAAEEGGLDAQKAVAAQIRKADRNGIVGYIAAYLSVRAEPASLLNTFSTDTRDRANRIANPALRDYICFRLLWDARFSQSQLANVLLIAQSLSIVDLYEAFIDVLQHAIATSLTPELLSFLRMAIAELHSIGDFRLTKIALFIGLHPSSGIGARPLRGTQLLLTGDVRRGSRAAIRELSESPRGFRTAIVCAAALGDSHIKMRSAGNTVWSETIRDIANLYHFGDDFSIRLQSLEKALINRTFSRSLKACCHELRANLSQDSGERRKNHVLALLNNYFADPEENEHYLHRNIAPPAATSTASRIFQVLVACRDAAAVADISALRDLDQQSESLGFRPLRIYSRRSYISALFDAGDLTEGLRVTASAFFNLKMPTSLIPLDGSFTALRWRQMKPQSSNIVLPIVLDLCWRLTGNDQVLSNLRYSYDAMLAASGAGNPCELEVSREISLEQLIYFLRFVCVPQVIDMSLHIKSSRQTNELRRDICTRLSELDPTNSEEYSTETFAITRSLALQEGLQAIDSSRVYVDTAAITSFAMRELDSNLSRYQSLLTAGVVPSETIEDVLKELNTPGGAPVKFLKIPESDADIVLLDLITTLRQRFLLDPNHGLDSYLSKRVRHHSMSGYLRGAIENENLITTRDSLTGRYVANKHWPERIDGITPPENAQLQNALSKFGEDFDKELTVLRSEKLRIWGRENPTGLFQIPISAPIYHLIRSVVGAGVPMDVFCNVCYTIFWSSLDPSLSAAKRALEVEAYNAIASAFHKLKNSLRSIFKDSKRYSTISSSIQAASEEFNRKVHSVAEWFNRPESKISHQTYALDRALDICLEAAQHSLKPFAPKIVSHVLPSQSISSLGLVHLADIILTLLGNVRAHAASAEPPHVELNVSIAEGDVLSVRMESTIGRKACRAEALARVERIRAEIRDGTYIEKIRGEGNSGLIKLAGMAASANKGTIDFGFNGEESFFVDMRCELPSVLYLASYSAEQG